MLAIGKASLLKERTKRLIELKQYASATPECIMATELRYYVLRQDELYLVKTGADVPTVLPEAAARQRKNSRTEANLKAVVDAFNR